MAEAATVDEAPPEQAPQEAPEQAEAAGAGESGEAADGVEVSPAELPKAAPGEVPSGGGRLEVLLDTAMQVSVRLGQVEMPARKLVQLGPGSVVTLDRRAGEPVELLLRGTPFALGKLVVVGEQLGVKVERILSPKGAES